ncbi:hypothetical protein MKX01_023847 [Papaver californicum]|nr:hypothetical protein MKX01_023847 [Papaver californicum]
MQQEVTNSSDPQQRIHPMQYLGGAALMVMPHQMIPQHYPPHFMGLPHQQQHTEGSSSSSEENKTLRVGDLHYWMDENYLHTCFGHTGEVINIKVRFVEVSTRATAERVLQDFNGTPLTPMLNAKQPFRLNWELFNMGYKRSYAGSDKSIFVVLQETFASRYTSAKGAKVVIDANTGRSKGYGFVRLGDDSETTYVMTEMNGVYCGYASNGASAHDGDSTNTTIFQTFSQYGEITSVKIPLCKGCGFVQFANRNNIEEALGKLNGTTIGKHTVRLPRGRNQANKQMRADPSGQWGAIQYGGQVYDYKYTAPVAQDSSAAYGAYPVHGNQQEVS